MKNRTLLLVLTVGFIVVIMTGAQWLLNWTGNSKTTNYPTIYTGELDIAVCDPANGPFSTTIDNEYFPLAVGHQLTLEDPEGSEKVQITVLDETELIAGVVTRVVEEREWEDGQLTEVSRNFFVQASDGSVCYYGEDVDDYENGTVVAHGGAWRAGEGENKPGIIMSANPVVGQSYQQEVAPGVAMDAATHVALEPSYETTAGTFNNVLLVDETPSSTKRYAPGVGLIYDDGMELTSMSIPTRL